MRHDHQAFSLRQAALPQPKVYSYTRWSTPEQAKGDSMRRQAEAAARWAMRNNLILDETLAITDSGRSAYRGGNAEGDAGLSRFLQACRAGLIEPGSFLLVESLDRISRMAPRRAQRLIDDIVDNGVTIVTLNDDQHYSAERLDNDPTALLIALMVAWRAHEESRTKGRRVAEAWREKRRLVRAGEVERLTCRAPAWLVPDGSGWRVDEPKAQIVRRIYALTLTGMGEQKIAATLNVETVPVLGRGKRWHRSTVAKVLRSPAVIGTLVPGYIEHVGGKKLRRLEEPVPNAYPAIIPEAEWLAVRALKDGKAGAARGRHAGRGVAHILAGIAKCPECGSTMSRVFKGARTKAGKPKLVCGSAKGKAGCRYVGVRIEDVEEAFFRDWAALYQSVPAGGEASGLDQEYANLSGAISGLEDYLRDLNDALERGDRSQSVTSSMARAEAELRDLRLELGRVDERRRLTDHGLVCARLDALYDLLHPEGEEVDRAAINAALKVLFSAVVVDYRTGHLRFQWRQGGEASILYSWVEV